METLDGTLLSFWFRQAEYVPFEVWRNSAVLEPDEQAFVRDVVDGTLAKPEAVAKLLEESHAAAQAQVWAMREMAVAA